VPGPTRPSTWARSSPQRRTAFAVVAVVGLVTGVISNDSDLAFPVARTRDRVPVPVGLVDPTHGYPAVALNADRSLTRFSGHLV